MITHLPRPFHPPHTEGVAQSFSCHVSTTCRDLCIQIVIAQNLVQEVDVAAREFESLDLDEFIGGKSGYDLSQLVESVVETLCTLSFAYVRHAALVL